jgi:hypothetical protein
MYEYVYRYGYDVIKLIQYTVQTSKVFRVNLRRQGTKTAYPQKVSLRRFKKQMSV